MKTVSVALLALAAIAAFSSLSSSAQAYNLNFSYLGNKPYMNCLKLFYTGDYLMPRGLSPAQQAAWHEKGRRYCNRTYYGHE